ncbi:hypothetical protein ACUODJ_60595, partial [Escherichia sp. HC-CC]
MLVFMDDAVKNCHVKVLGNDKRSQIFTLSRYAGILRRCLKENAMSAQKPGLHPRNRHHSRY